MALEIALTKIRCEACGRDVVLLTRDKRTNPDEPRQPIYITHDGTHDIENAFSIGTFYPDVFVVACRVNERFIGDENT